MPSPFAGRIARLHAPGGSTVAVGAPLVTFDVAVGAEPVVLGEAETLPAPPPTATCRHGAVAGAPAAGSPVRRDPGRPPARA